MQHIMHKKSTRSFPVIDRLAILVGILQPIMTIPQIVMVVSIGDASQISLWTWLTYDIASVVLITYGIKHKLAPIIIAQVAWLIVQTIMIALIFLY
jgi:uncharacterized protein with PQ loop repeat